MPRKMSDTMHTRMIKTLRYMITEAPCTTIARVANKLDVSWSMARNALYQLAKNKMVLKVEISRATIWCVDENAATNAIFEIKRTLWRLICNSRRRYITPSDMLRLIAADTEAHNIFAKYVDVNSTHGHTLHFIASALEDLLGKPMDKRQRRLLFHVTPRFCKKAPTLADINLSHYTSAYRLVTFKVPTAMHNDMLEAARTLGLTTSELVTMAIDRLLSQYRHVLDGKGGADLKAN
ncbi:hypothetical protein PyrSV_gp48 [Pyrobaculum spherical virus]|uniref:Uncharacterized protein n=1 Tax=Pyrobaculum spherical virus (isolate United States/Yellowstone) TaxID=654907 RepID=Q6ZYF5_PSVY|nr:hypothetical protein PyrSV_gp48 [Pyrobaculum spherical virus]CAG25667.1 hypothetical protein [Pyrobaculum spherical virus]